MSKPLYTPGPWRVRFNDGSGPSYIRSIEKDKSVARVRWGCGCCEDESELTEEEKANLALITTAPDMHETLKRFVSLLPTLEGMGGYAPMGAFLILGEHARKVIAKAERRIK